MSFLQRFFRPNIPKSDTQSKETENKSAVTPAPAPAVGSEANGLSPLSNRNLAAGVTRPLPPEPIMAYETQGMRMVFGQSSDQGMVRSNNQDAAFSFLFSDTSIDMHPPFGLFIVADGMGGHSFGEKAAAIATRIIASEVLNKIYLPLLKNTVNGNSPHFMIAETLLEAFQQANDYIITHVKDGGTTATALLILGNQAHIAHVGDSRAYLVDQHGIEQITRDHSLVQRLIELNQLTVDEAKEHSQRNVLYRALGQSTDLEVDIQTRRLSYATNILLCSDGLWGWVEEQDIQQTVTNTQDAQETCNKLIAQANANGGHDNITAILFKMPAAG